MNANNAGPSEEIAERGNTAVSTSSNDIGQPLSIVTTAKSFPISYVTGKLMERAFGSDLVYYQDKFNKDPVECALFEKYNMPSIPTNPSDTQTPSIRSLAYVRYLPSSISSIGHQSSKASYPSIRSDLGYYPMLTYYQRLSQNIYSFKDDTRVEEKDVNLRSTRSIPHDEIGVVSIAAMEDMTLFRQAIDAESFGK